MAVEESGSRHFKAPELTPKAAKKIANMEIPEVQKTFHCPNCKTVIQVRFKNKKKCPVCFHKFETRKYVRKKPLKDTKKIDIGGSLSKRQNEYFMYDRT